MTEAVLGVVAVIVGALLVLLFGAVIALQSEAKRCAAALEKIANAQDAEQ